jgi:nucleotide-binding universal stress UspA family protein
MRQGQSTSSGAVHWPKGIKSRLTMKNTTSQPIICGTDFSENARQTANVAAALAARLSAHLVLVHATGLPIQDSTAEAYDAVNASFRERLHEEAERSRGLVATVEEILSAGAPDEVLVQLAKQRQARLLVVSSIGLRAPTRFLLGSVAERTAESSPVPTLVVRDAAPFEAWARGERPLNVFVGVDFTANSDAALRWVSELRQIGPCEVVAAYADWPREETARLGGSGSLGPLESPPEVQRALERDIQEKVARLLGKEYVRIVVKGGWGRADAQLVGLATEAQADLIVVGTHQWHGLSRLRHGSVSRGILYHSPTSVACVPTPAAPPITGPRVRECRRVLAAADLGASHGFAAPYAYSIVNPGGTVRLVHIVEPFQSTNPLMGRHYQDLPTRKEHAQQVAASEARLRALAPTEAEARGIKTEVEVLENLDKAKAICAAAVRFDADVVCIGGHTRPGFTAKILGSVALGVLTQCRRPVLIVWPPAE